MDPINATGGVASQSAGAATGTADAAGETKGQPAVLAASVATVGGMGAEGAESKQKIDVGSATSTSPTEKVQTGGAEMTGLQSAGVNLAKWVLTIIAVALFILTILVTSSELWPTSDITEVHKLVLEIHSNASKLKGDDPSLPLARKDLAELTRQIVDAKQAQRAFWIQFSQMILLNLLLPVLTAILGYVFGANSNKSYKS